MAMMPSFVKAIVTRKGHLKFRGRDETHFPANQFPSGFFHVENGSPFSTRDRREEN